MKKIIACRPVNEIELVLQGGESVSLRFDIEALMEFNNLDGGLVSLLEKDLSLTDMCIKIVYTSAHGSLDIEKAKEIVSNLSPLTITEIINEFNESMGATNKEMNGDFAKKMMAQFLQKISK